MQELPCLFRPRSPSPPHRDPDAPALSQQEIKWCCANWADNTWSLEFTEIRCRGEINTVLSVSELASRSFTVVVFHFPCDRLWRFENCPLNNRHLRMSLLNTPTLSMYEAIIRTSTWSLTLTELSNSMRKQSQFLDFQLDLMKSELLNKWFPTRGSDSPWGRKINLGGSEMMGNKNKFFFAFILKYRTILTPQASKNPSNAQAQEGKQDLCG